MSGKGKYTVYVPPKSARRTFFEKLFAGSTTSTPPFLGIDQDKSILDANKLGNDLLRAASTAGIQKGDSGYFPDGVDMNFTGAKATIQAPDTSEGKSVKWTKAGDPAFSYLPDISSPGPGKTEGTDKAVDPKITAADIKPVYVPGAPGTGTKSPTESSDKVSDASELGGTGLKLGDSGANS